MDLIDRYLVAVRRQLPDNLQDDITAELADSLRSDAEERERVTGHPLDEAEQAALLKQRGHPFLMASRYLPQQQLIGPALFPYYRQTLKFVVFGAVLPITLLSATITAISAGAPADVISRMIAAAWNGSIYSIGIVTLVFAILEHEQLRISVLENWNPRQLPQPQHGRTVPRSESVVGLVVSLTFLVWWTGRLEVAPMDTYEGAPVRFTAAPIWSAMYYPILLVLTATIALHLIDLLRPWRTLAVTMANVAAAAAATVIVAIVLRAGHFIDVTGAPEHAEQLARADWGFNLAIRVTVSVIGLVSLFEILYELWKLSKTRGSR
jgi:hypothetical protein